VDVLRGLTIAVMILVNDPGDWAHTYAQLDHAPWNGFTLTDLVFPNFLFIVGASIIFSLESRLARGESKRTLALHMFRRAATIFAIKMFLTAYPHFHLTHLRIFGVLTRIAVCYLAAGLICLATQRKRTLGIITAAILIGYWALMRFVPVPGLAVASPSDAIPTHTIPILDPNNNLAAWLDRAFNAFTIHFFHTGVLYNKTHDPEGLLSTLPAIATTLIGCITGLYLRRKPAQTTTPDETDPPEETRALTTPTRTTMVLIAAALLLFLGGILWNPYFPVNKNLWTSSYVLYSAGWSLVLLASCYWFIDVRRLNEHRAGKWLIWPWLVFGSNAITAFVLSNFIVETMIWIRVPAGALVYPMAPGVKISAWLWSYRHLFARHHSTSLTSLAFALTFTAICFIPNWILWRKKIFLKI
jgi:predicted acyltransferase